MDEKSIENFKDLFDQYVKIMNQEISVSIEVKIKDMVEVYQPYL